MVAAALVAPLVLASPTGAQEKPKAKAAVKAPATSKWSPAKTPWGDPDLRGNWPLDYLASTPRVRPAQYGTRAELTDKEYEAALKAARANAQLYDKETKINKMGMGHWTERGQPLRQTSLTVEPADGRMPASKAFSAGRAATSIKPVGATGSWAQAVMSRLRQNAKRSLMIRTCA